MDEKRTGSLLMLIGALSFVGYGIVFLIRSFIGKGFELGIDTINGVTQAQLNTINPVIVHYINI